MVAFPAGPTVEATVAAGLGQGQERPEGSEEEEDTSDEEEEEEEEEAVPMYVYVMCAFFFVPKRLRRCTRGCLSHGGRCGIC